VFNYVEEITSGLKTKLGTTQFHDSKESQEVRRHSLERVLFRTIKNATRFQVKTCSWSLTDAEESTSSPKTMRGASSFHGFKDSRTVRRRSEDKARSELFCMTLKKAQAVRRPSWEQSC
jgi:hypothetical protein